MAFSQHAAEQSENIGELSQTATKATAARRIIDEIFQFGQNFKKIPRAMN